MIAEPLKALTDDELRDALQETGTPIMLELMERGYRVRLEERSASGVPIFIVTPVPRAIAE